MEPYNAIRAGIFFVAGLLLIIFTEKMMKFQDFMLKKVHLSIKYRNSKHSIRILGILFWIVAAVLLAVSTLS